MLDRDQLFIGGKWKRSEGKPIEVLDCTTEEVIGRVPEATVNDVAEACAAAREALSGWSATDPLQRSELLFRLSEILDRRSAEVAEIVTREVGMPIKLSKRIQAGLPVIVTRQYSELLKGFSFEEQVANSRVAMVPKGVVAAITPWNYPLHQLVNKMAPALAAGCTMVAKPSEEAPLSAFVLAEAIEEAGFPAGVFNVVTGYGKSTGKSLVEHPEIDMISFTGSNATGRTIAAMAASSAKRVTLEMGGKSPSVLLDDADMNAAVRATLSNCFLNSGQTCTALTRLIAPRSRITEIEELVGEHVRTFVVGDPHDPATRLGPLVSARQRDGVLAYIEQGRASGAKVLLDGDGQALPAKGYFVAPTVFSRVQPDSVVAQEEIFGPVLCIIAYDNEDEAVEIANGTIYGLAAAVWSADAERAFRIARRIRAGQIDINGAAFNPRAPFGGFKQSGYGRELGRWGLEEFVEPQSFQLPS